MHVVIVSAKADGEDLVVLNGECRGDFDRRWYASWQYRGTGEGSSERVKSGLFLTARLEAVISCCCHIVLYPHAKGLPIAL